MQQVDLLKDKDIVPELQTLLQPLGKILTCEHFNKGFQNTIYLLTTTKGVYCLRVYGRADEKHISYELAVLDRLRGLAVPQPIKINGSYLFKINGKWAIVYAYLQGATLKEVQDKHLDQIGEFLGEMHNKLAGFSWKKRRFAFYTISDYRIKTYSAAVRKAGIPYLEQLPAVVKDLRANQLDPKLPKGAIHVDLSPNNTLEHDGNISGVVDFDNGHVGPMILDLGKTVMFYAKGKGTFDAAKARRIIKAYEQVRPLSRLEKQQMAKAIRFAFLSHIFMDYYMFAIKVTPRSYFDWIVNDLYKAYQQFTMDEKAFSAFMGW